MQKCRPDPIFSYDMNPDLFHTCGYFIEDPFFRQQVASIRPEQLMNRCYNGPTLKKGGRDDGKKNGYTRT